MTLLSHIIMNNFKGSNVLAHFAGNTFCSSREIMIFITFVILLSFAEIAELIPSKICHQKWSRSWTVKFELLAELISLK